MKLIDMHSHILPEADHGSDSVETSIEQLKRARRAGVSVILATPHFYYHSDNIDDFLIRREKSYRKLKKAMSENGLDDIRIFLGAEVRLEVDLLKETRLSKLCIEGTNKLLLEMPFDMKWTEWIYNYVFEIAVKYKIKPIIAHIDRYEDKPAKRLMDMGLEAQINASSLCHFSSRMKMMKYVKSGAVKYLGSDVHGPKSPEYNEFEKGVRILGKYADDIMYNSAKVLGLADRAEENGEKNIGGGLIF